MHKRLLAVWAHPDDESFGPVGTMCLAREQGWQTAILCATRGEGGQPGDVALPPGVTLSQLREQELRCACQHIGIDTLYLWNLPDGGLRDMNPSVLHEQVLDVMRAWQPRVVLTFGPDGITGHPDHIAIGSATTSAFEALHHQQDASRSQALYYVTTAPQRRVDHRMGDAPPPGPIHAQLDVANYRDTKLAALHCHATQRGGWESLRDNTDWLTIDRFTRVVPPPHHNEPVAPTLFDD